MATTVNTPGLARSLNGSAATIAKLFDNYSPHTTAWDELFSRTGDPHPHCTKLVERLGGCA